MVERAARWRTATAILLLTASALPLAAPARQAGPPAASAGSAQGDVSVTICTNDTALVQDVRRLTLAQGRVQQSFPDVSAAIRPETVSPTVAKQDFDYDLPSPSSLIEKAVGETITLSRTDPATGAETRERAEVLAVDGGVVKIGERIEVLRDDGMPVRAW